jgi:osmotically inducible protein OsmC
VVGGSVDAASIGGVIASLDLENGRTHWRRQFGTAYGSGAAARRPSRRDGSSSAWTSTRAEAAPEVRGLTKGTDMNDELQILYTAEATAVGGRAGHARTSDCRLDVALDVPREMGGQGGPGTNPEQLFAVGYAACFQSALLRIAAGRKLDLGASRITARVGIGVLRSGGFGLAATLDLDAPQLSREEGADLMRRAHQDCPYSRATRGNIHVTLSVGGIPADEGRAAA